MTRRLEITLSDETWDRLNDARGHEPRASFVKRALEAALVEPHDAGMSPELKAQLRKSWASPELESQLLAGPGTKTHVVREAPKLPPGVRTARELASERQAALNKAKGS